MYHTNLKNKQNSLINPSSIAAGFDFWRDKETERFKEAAKSLEGRADWERGRYREIQRVWAIVILLISSFYQDSINKN
jgi:hypothetical protein